MSTQEKLEAQTFVVWIPERMRPVGHQGPFKADPVRAVYTLTRHGAQIVPEGGKVRDDLRLSRMWIVPEGTDPNVVRELVEEWITLRNLMHQFSQRLDDIEGAGADMDLFIAKATDLERPFANDGVMYAMEVESARRAQLRVVALLKLYEKRKGNWREHVAEIAKPGTPAPSTEPTEEVVRVLEVDQWTASGNVEAFTADTFSLDAVVGSGAASVRAMGIARAQWRNVRTSDRPLIGSVWFRHMPDGMLKRWKQNIDSSG